jgi:hypothetical protein
VDMWAAALSGSPFDFQSVLLCRDFCRNIGTSVGIPGLLSDIGTSVGIS